MYNAFDTIVTKSGTDVFLELKQLLSTNNINLTINEDHTVTYNNTTYKDIFLKHVPQHELNIHNKLNKLRDQNICFNFVYTFGHFTGKIHNNSINGRLEESKILQAPQQIQGLINVMEKIPFDLTNIFLNQWKPSFSLFVQIFIQLLFANYISQKYLFITQGDPHQGNILFKNVHSNDTTITYILSSNKKLTIPFSIHVFIIDFNGASCYNSYNDFISKHHPFDTFMMYMFQPKHYSSIFTIFTNEINKKKLSSKNNIVKKRLAAELKKITKFKNLVTNFYNKYKNDKNVNELQLISFLESQNIMNKSTPNKNNIVCDLTKINQLTL